MADFRLPELKPAQVDYPNAFARGYAAVDQMQTPGLTNTLSQQKIDEENRLRQGGLEYQQSGDINALAVAKPMEVATLRELQRKRDMEELLPLMKIGVAYGGGLAKPETFQQTRDSLVGMHPKFDTLLPQTYTPGWYEQAYTNAVKALKLTADKDTTKMWVGGRLVDTGQTGPVVNMDPRGLSVNDRISVERAKAGLKADQPTTVLGTDLYGLGDRTVKGWAIQPRLAPQTETPVFTQDQIDQAAKEGRTLPKGYRTVPRPLKSNTNFWEPGGAAGTPGAGSAPPQAIFEQNHAMNGEPVYMKNPQTGTQEVWKWVNGQAQKVQ